MKTRLFGMLAAVLLSIGASAQSEDYALANFDHEVTQPAPGGLKPLISVDSVFNFPQTNVVMCPPNVKHWHGAAPNSRFAHLAASTNPDRPTVVWTDEILSKEEYDQLPKE